jgi:hypothetical protein
MLAALNSMKAANSAKHLLFRSICLHFLLSSDNVWRFQQAAAWTECTSEELNVLRFSWPWSVNTSQFSKNYGRVWWQLYCESKLEKRAGIRAFLNGDAVSLQPSTVICAGTEGKVDRLFLLIDNILLINNIWCGDLPRKFAARSVV